MTPFVRSAAARKRSARMPARLVAAALVVSTMGAARAEPAWTRIAGTQAGGQSVAQTGSAADEIRANLKRIRLPPGFAIELYALVPDARHMAVAPGTDTLFVGTQTGTVWAVTHRAGAAPAVTAFVPSERFVNPNGVCFAGDGTLVVAQRNRVSRYRVDGSWNDPANVARADILAQGQLLPPDEEATGHSARTCRVGPDDKVYVTIGEPFNVQPRAKVERYRALGIGGIVRMNAFDGTKREVYATGVRNSVGMNFNPKDGTLWFTDNQTDNLGDDQPPGELDHATKPGQDFGYPYWCGHVKVAGSPVARDLADPARTGRRGVPASRVPRASGATGHDVLRKHDVSGAVPRRHLRRGARLVEPDGVDSARSSTSFRWSPTPRPARASCSRRASGATTARTGGGRSTSRRCATARCWSATTRRAPSTGSRTSGPDAHTLWGMSGGDYFSDWR